MQSTLRVRNPNSAQYGPVFAAAFAVLSLAIALRADDQKTKEDSLYQISPTTVVRGKDYNVVIRPRAACQEPSGPLKGVQVDLDNVSGFKPTDTKGDKTCFLRFKLSVADDAPLGELNVPLVLVEGEKKSPFDVLTLAAADRQPAAGGSAVRRTHHRAGDYQ